jgi:hypothetical protein
MYLDHSNPDSIASNTRTVLRTLKGLRHDLRKGELQRCCGDDGLDVRLVANSDGELWITTGDVQYDTEHGAACEASTISPNSSNEELEQTADELVQGVADQLADLAPEDM